MKKNLGAGNIIVRKNILLNKRFIIFQRHSKKTVKKRPIGIIKLAVFIGTCSNNR